MAYLRLFHFLKNMHFCSANGQNAGYLMRFLSHNFGISLYENSATVRQLLTMKKSLTSGGESGIIKERKIVDRNMANWLRKSADRSVFKFRDGYGSGYSDERDVIFISFNIFSSNNGSKHPRDLMSERAAIAVELKLRTTIS
jgi:hypothetical protein